jgi:hypothetical protein
LLKVVLNSKNQKSIIIWLPFWYRQKFLEETNKE